MYDVASNHFKDESCNFTIDGTCQNIWDMVGDIDQVTSDLELYLTVSNQNSHPYLSWNAYHTTNILGYNVYKRITLADGGSSYTYSTFTTSTSFLDNDFEIDPRYGDHVDYWIQAKISSSQESREGNQVQVSGESFIQWKSTNDFSLNNTNYKLSQNYPNPFNPNTILSYQLKENCFVNLTVYNSIGESVIQLVNQQQDQGNHSIEFNAANLPSGIYYYKLQTDKYSDVKKMILLR